MVKLYRSTLDIFADVLYVVREAGEEGIGRSRIIQGSGVPHRRIGSYLDTLIENNFLECSIVENGQEKYNFKIKAEGIEWLTNYEAFKKFCNELGLPKYNLSQEILI